MRRFIRVEPLGVSAAMLQRGPLDRITDWFRKVSLLLNWLILALVSLTMTYVAARFLLHLLGYLNRTLFRAPW